MFLFLSKNMLYGGNWVKHPNQIISSENKINKGKNMFKINIKSKKFTTPDHTQNHVLKDIEFSIEENDFLSIIGPSGCGKTTILRILAGFDNDFDYSTGIIKYVHPDLEIQFITPERGRGRDKAYDIKQLQIKAEGI